MAKTVVLIGRARGMGETLAIRLADKKLGGATRAAHLHRIAAALIEADVSDCFAYVTPDNDTVHIERCEGESLAGLAKEAATVIGRLGFSVSIDDAAVRS